MVYHRILNIVPCVRWFLIDGRDAEYVEHDRKEPDEAPLKKGEGGNGQRNVLETQRRWEEVLVGPPKPQEGSGSR